MIDKWINTKDELKALAKTLGVRDDWHEPDEQDVAVTMVAGPLDNAFGDTTEAHIILTHLWANDDGTEVTYAVNAANLLAWASA
jgi:hypothetical protein